MTPRHTLSVTLNKSPGGIANAFVAYIRAMQMSGTRQHVIIPSESPIVAELEKIDNVTLFARPRNVLKWHLLTHFAFTPKTRQIIVASDLVLLHNAGLYKYLAAWGQKACIVNHLGPRHHNRLVGCFAPRHTKPPRIIFLTTAERDRFLARLDVASQTAIIPNGFDMSVKPHPRPTTANAPPKIISVGRLAKEKGFFDLIAAAEILQQRGIACQINVFGDGELGAELRQVVATHKVKNIAFCGWSGDMEQQYAAHDIFCLPSYVEAFPMALGEAMRAALPVVATDAEGPPEAFGTTDTRARGGIICPIGDVAALADALAELIENPSLREQMGQAAQKTVTERFSFEALAQNIEKLYR